MQLLCVLLLAWARARAPIPVTDGPMADRSRPAALEKVGVQSQVSMHHAEKADGVATGVARSASADVMPAPYTNITHQHHAHRRGEKPPSSPENRFTTANRAETRREREYLPGYCGNDLNDRHVNSSGAFCQSTFRKWYRDGAGQPWHNSHPTMQECVERCAACAECRYASYALQLKDCSLYAACDTGTLSQMPAGYITAEVRPKDKMPACVATKMPTCTLCLASALQSRASVSEVPNGMLIQIHSVTQDCRRKISGGDSWVVSLQSHVLPLWRIVSTDHGNGKYEVRVPPHLLPATAKVELWWTSSDSGFLHSSAWTQWPVEAGRLPTWAHTFRSACAAEVNVDGCLAPTVDCSECSPKADAYHRAMMCVGRGLVGAGNLTLQPTAGSSLLLRIGGKSIGPSAVGRHRGGDMRPGGASRPAAHLFQRSGGLVRHEVDFRRCLGSRRLVVLGDSITFGSFLDMCERLGGGCGIMTPEALSVPPNVSAVFSPVFALPYRVGLPTFLRAEAFWTAVLGQLPGHTVLVLQSGAHDVGMPKMSQPVRESPILQYRVHMSRLANWSRHLLTAHGDQLQLVWRQTTHIVLPPGGCNGHGHGLAHPGVVTALNDVARELLVPAGVTMWEEPAWMSLNAPQQYAGGLHHDRCRGGCQGSATGCKMAVLANGNLSGLSHCAQMRLRGQPWGPEPWGHTLSEAISETLFTSVLGCM